MGGTVAYTQWIDLDHVAHLGNIAPTDPSIQMPTRDKILVGSMFWNRIEAILSSCETQVDVQWGERHATTEREKITHPRNEIPALAKYKHHYCISIRFALIWPSQLHCVF